MIVTKVFTFEAAHKLEGYDGKCANLHGHRYKLEVSVKGDVGADGMVMDFKEIKKIVQEMVISKLDHGYLNDVIKVPTAENIVIWVWDRLKDKLNLHELKLWETENSFVVYCGD
jgi:6-pyruvoyltetrahydropterin/6-carboxytetrahydropterin synthase